MFKKQTKSLLIQRFFKQFKACLFILFFLPWLPTLASTETLANHPSPYLAMHAQDPIHWQTWSQKVLQQAQKHQKLILLSSGYYACHWCHVMHQQSYQNPQIAQLINQHFIAVKIDRELSPDLDAYLIRFSKQVIGRAGWPQHVILTPKGHPTVAFTYLRPEALRQTLNKFTHLWQQQPQQIIQMAQAFTPPSTPLKPIPLRLKDTDFQTRLYQQLTLAKDDISGGIGTQKFPKEPLLIALLQQPQLPPELQDWLQLTLEQMQTQHLQDHIHGGFFRYTTDPNWQTPHFEKMLYNQAQLIHVYLLAYQRWHRPQYLNTALTTYTYVRNHLWNPKAQLFMSSESALDFQHQEGGNVLYTAEQLKAKLPPTLYQVVLKAWQLDQAAPFENGWLPTPQGIPEKLWFQIQQNLQRDPSQIPHDDKSILSWNALMLQALYQLRLTLPANHPLAKEIQTTGQTLQNRLLQLMQTEQPPRALDAQGKPIGQATLEEYSYLIQALKIAQAFLPATETTRKIKQLETSAHQNHLTPYGWHLSTEPLLPGQTGHWVLKDDALPSASTPIQCPFPQHLAQIQDTLYQTPLDYPSVLTLLQCISHP